MGQQPKFFQTLAAAAADIIAPTGIGKQSARKRSEPFCGKLRVAPNSGPRKRMRAMARGIIFGGLGYKAIPAARMHVFKNASASR